MNTRVVFASLVLSLVTGYASASPQPDLVPASPKLQTERWLQIQREGNAQSKKVQTATPAERELAMQRLLKSYEHAIPEYFGETDGGKFKR